MSNQRTRLHRLLNRPVLTHYVPAFTRRHPDGTQESFCQTFVTAAQHSTEPTCPECVRLLASDAADLDALRTDAREEGR